MKNSASRWSIAALVTFLFMAAGCERNYDGLELATYPATPEVFIDNFSAGLYYAAYGTSKVTAFSVDYAVKHTGTCSMRFDVPDEGDPGGSYAGGVFGTNPPRDLSAYNVLTFWAKASQPVTIIEVGFGNDMGASTNKVTLSQLAVNATWMQYYIPIPDPSVLKQERGMFFYAAAPDNGRGYTFWVDDLKFEQLGTIAHSAFGIYDGKDTVKTNAEPGDKFAVQGLYAKFNLPTGIDEKVGLTASYFTFSSSDSAVASVDHSGMITINDSGTAVITARSGDVMATGSMTIHCTGKVVAPAEPPPTPVIPGSNVISLYSNAYSNVPVDTWNAHWLYSTAEDQFIKIQDDDVIRYRNLNFVGITFTSPVINAESMSTLHLDIWTPNPTTNKKFKVMLVDFGADGVYGGGDDSSSEITITSPVLKTQQWVLLDLPLASFSSLKSKAHLAQMVLSGELPDVYVDNVFFYNNGTSPVTAAPVPTFNPSDVISIFSSSYTNLAGTDFYPSWGQTTVVTQVTIEGVKTLRYGGLNYQGIQLNGSQNISGMSYLHLDYWTANSTLLKVYLISPGPVEKPYTLTVPTIGWQSVDIPLSSFSPVDLQNLIQLKFDGNGDIYLENILFRK